MQCQQQQNNGLAVATSPDMYDGTISPGVYEPHIKLEPMRYYECQNLSESTTPSSDSQSVSLLNDNVADKPITPPKNTHHPPKSKPQSCKVCGKVLSSASSYYVHMKLHSGMKPFQCTVCEAAFCRKPYLEVHMRTHTGERPFQCEVCMKRFTQKSSLNTHRRVHTGERPYGCDICEKRFAVKSYVAAHRWSHVADKPLACEQCNMTFTSKNQFAIHIRTHTTGQTYECNVCGRTFVRDSYLLRHHNRVHRENAPAAFDLSYMASPVSNPPSASVSPDGDASQPCTK